MATLTEVQSLEEINYHSKIKFFFLLLLVGFLFTVSFFNFYPIGESIKSQLRKHSGTLGCAPDFDQIRMEWFLPKIIISDLTLPARCLNRQGEPLKFTHVTLNWNLINFTPFGLPFRLETEMAGQPITIYYVLGLNQQMIRVKDQKLNFARLQPLLGDKFKVSGNITLDLNLIMANNVIKNLDLKAASTDLEIPSQNLEGFTLASMKLNDFHLEATSVNHPRIQIEKLFLGDPNSPVRANFRGKIDLQEGNAAFSPIDLTGEVAFSETFKQSLPLVDMMFQSFTQKDGFYQIRLGGTLGAPKPSAP